MPSRLIVHLNPFARFMVLFICHGGKIWSLWPFSSTPKWSSISWGSALSSPYIRMVAGNWVVLLRTMTTTDLRVHTKETVYRQGSSMRV